MYICVRERACACAIKKWHDYAQSERSHCVVLCLCDCLPDRDVFASVLVDKIIAVDWFTDFLTRSVATVDPLVSQDFA